jgi:hypothetical protein
MPQGVGGKGAAVAILLDGICRENIIQHPAQDCLAIIQKDLEQELLVSTHDSVSAHISASKHNRRRHTLLPAHARQSPAHSRS